MIRNAPLQSLSLIVPAKCLVTCSLVTPERFPTKYRSPSGDKAVRVFQVRIQETQAELPRGSIPRSVEVILRAEAVEAAQAGDRCDFTGTLIVVPDVSAMALSGEDLATVFMFT